jgi:transposase
MENINLVAIDLAKQSFQVRAINHNGRALFDRKVSREQLSKQILSLPSGTRIAMEACGSAHYWGREFKAAGFKVDLIAPQYVKPFVKTQKNDSADAEGIAEAASRASMRFVPVKSLEQQDIQSIHRVRERYMKNRTALMNELRGLLLEYGIAIPQGFSALMRHLPLALESESVTESMKFLVRELHQELLDIEKRLSLVNKKIEAIAKSLEVCRQLMEVPGIGEITATALYASVGHMQFKNGRELAAFLGLVPRQRSSGGKQKLGRITKNGDVYVRKLLVHGARSVLLNAHRHKDRYSSWAKAIYETKGYTKGAVALANKNARIAWAIMSSGVPFDHDFAQQAVH